MEGRSAADGVGGDGTNLTLKLAVGGDGNSPDGPTGLLRICSSRLVSQEPIFGVLKSRHSPDRRVAAVIRHHVRSCRPDQAASPSGTVVSWINPELVAYEMIQNIKPECRLG